MSQNFDAFDAPQFIDFSKDLHKEEENPDSYFEVDHEHEIQSKEDPLKSRESFEIISDNSVDLMCIDTVEPSIEEINEEFYSPLTTPAAANQHGPFDRRKIRQSISLDNLHFPSKTKDNGTSKDEVLRGMSALTLETKESTTKKISGSTRKASSNTSLNSNKAGATRKSAPRLTRVMSQENINRLAQPKRLHSSTQSLPQKDNYVTMAEAVKKFESGTPDRFRTRPKFDMGKGIPSRLLNTIPKSPALLAKDRHRPINAISREEQEKLDAEEIKKFKIRANPVNKKALHGPLKPTVLIEKKPCTIPEPFKITAVVKKASLVENKVPDFQANPAPRCIREPPKMKEVPKPPITKPVTPSFMKRCPPKIGKSPIKQVDEDKQPKRLGQTKPVPFSFEKRDEYVKKKKEEIIRKVLEEEKKAREFHARPAPAKILSKHNSLSRSGSSGSIGSNGRTKSAENLTTQFKAKPALVLHKKPFEPKKEERPLIEITEFQLNTEIRAREREEFEKQKREKEERVELAKQVDEELRLRQEEEEVARLRKEMEYKAQPIKKFKEVKVEPSGQITIPVSPKWHVRNKNRSNDKENFESDAL